MLVYGMRLKLSIVLTVIFATPVLYNFAKETNELENLIADAQILQVPREKRFL